MRVVKRGTEVATVQIVDLSYWAAAIHQFPHNKWWSEEQRQTPMTGGARTFRPAADSWAEAARTFSRPDTIDNWMRVEWTGDGTEWLDLIGDGPDGSLVRLRLHPGEEGPHVVALEVSAAPGSQIGARFLRKLGVGHPLDAFDWALYDPEIRVLAGGRWCQRIYRPGRAGRPDIDYAMWAERYVAAIEADPVTPIKHLVAAEKAAGRHTSESAVKAIINKARRARGLLTEAEPGKPGGELTPKAKKILQGG